MGPLGHSLAALTALAGAPVGLCALALRPRWRPGLSQRLGAVPQTPPGSLWIHGASVGEVRAALPLLEAAERAGHPVVASSMTLGGQQVLARARPKGTRTLAPLDHPWLVTRALARVRPRALVMVETELWPAWIAAAAAQRIPVVIVSGRLSDRSFPRYLRLRPVLASTLARLAMVGARSAEDARRFETLGLAAGRVCVTGDLKLEPPARPEPLAGDLAAVLGDAALVVGGSTHPGEEDALLQALAQAERNGLAPVLALAPRRPERADAVEALAVGAGRRVRRRSALGSERLAPGDVLLLDGFGDLAGLYTRARVAFVGGSLVPAGGHNLLEPVHAGAPVLFGPSTESAREAATLLVACGAGLRVEDPAALAAAIAAALRNPEAAQARAAAGRAALEVHRGSALRSLALIEAVLAGNGERG